VINSVATNNNNNIIIIIIIKTSEFTYRNNELRRQGATYDEHATSAKIVKSCKSV